MQTLKATVGNGHQPLEMADSESQTLDSRNIVMGISNHLAIMQMKLARGPLHAGSTKSHI